MYKSSVFSSFKGRLSLLVGFFFVVLLGFSVVMLLRNRLIKEEIEQLLEVRLRIRDVLEETRTSIQESLAEGRSNILKQTPLNDMHLRTIHQHYRTLDSLKADLADTNGILLNELNTGIAILTKNFVKADSIWDYHLVKRQEGNFRLYSTDPYTDQLRRATPTEANYFTSDTLVEKRFEAEDGYYIGAFLNYTHTGFTGKGYVDYSNADKDFTEWRFKADRDGLHLISFRYANGSEADRPLLININGAQLDSLLSFPPVKVDDWKTWSNTSPILITLDAGIHSLKATATGHSGANIDHLTVVSLPSEVSNFQNSALVAHPGTVDTTMFPLLAKQAIRNTNDGVVGNAVENLLGMSLIKAQIDLNALRHRNEELLQLDLARLQEQLRRTNTFNFVTSALVAVLVVIATYVVLQSLNKSIKYPIEQLEKLCLGQTVTVTPPRDELNAVVRAGNDLSVYLNKASEFARQIGEGNLQQPFDKASDDDVLGNALLQMRDKLRALAKEDEQRNWQTAGLARFAEMLRKDFEDQQSLVLSIIIALVKYVEANQGGLFLISDNDEERFLEMAGCYAYDRRKYLSKRIELGEGLVGQVFLEGETTHLVNVPDDYVTIRSGLGGANPQSLLLVPIKTDTETLGVLELASFGKFAQYEIEFVEKVAEMVASSVLNMRINERTERLLAETRVQTQMLREQEEELRQNMEEMQATQEQMHRNTRHNDEADK